MLLENLNPRKHLSAAIGWAVFLVIALAAPFCAWLVAKETESYTRSTATQSLQQNAEQIHREIAANLKSHLTVVRLVAAQLNQDEYSAEEAKRLFHATKKQYPEFDWIGLTDDSGIVVAATNDTFTGRNFSYQPWFVNGRQGSYLGDIRNSLALANLLPKGTNRNSFRVIDFATPLSDDSDFVVGAHISWDWIKNLQALSLNTVDSERQEIQLILAAEDGRVLTGPSDMLGKPIPNKSDLDEDGNYLFGAHETTDDNSATLGWTIVIRANAAKTISAARSTQLLVILTILGAGSIAAILIVYSVSNLTRKLRKLSEDAEKVASGEIDELEPITGSDEVSRIGQVLATSMGNMQRQKNTLLTLNSELDQRVSDRTKEIARLSAESREIALTQQRLRFARDMHDTLAHSMMAVLTQIRLIRKVRYRLADSDLEEELGRAEEVALTGLQEARDAIKQIRSNNVEDKTISAALYDLVERFRSRSGVQYTLNIDPKSIHQETSRGETIYRIVEEALRNIEKHARAKNVKISLDRIDLTDNNQNSAPEFELEIVDDGAGFDPNNVASGHYGLIGLREQAELIDGSLMIDSTPGQGTRICLRYSAYYDF